MNKTAKYISKELNGEFPSSFDEIKKLKGIDVDGNPIQGRRVGGHISSDFELIRMTDEERVQAFIDEGLGNKFLANIREVDAIRHVIRCFEKENILLKCLSRIYHDHDKSVCRLYKLLTIESMCQFVY